MKIKLRQMFLCVIILLPTKRSDIMIKILKSRWRGMFERCYNPINKRYARYGGRGIKVCYEWQNFNKFYEWAIENGFSKELSIERINNDKDYSPNNCKWATNKEQSRNRSTNVKIEYDNESITLIELSEITKIPYKTLNMRYRRGDRGDYLVRPINKTTRKRGENNCKCKITENIAKEIKLKLKNGAKGSELALEYNVSKYLISDIKREKTWNWL